MSLIINKSGITINDVSYGFLHVTIEPEIELHYDRVSIKTECFDGLEASIYGLDGWWDSSVAILDPSIGPVDISIWIEPIQPIFPIDWNRFDPINVPFEQEASTNLDVWAHNKTKEELISVKPEPYSYMMYEDDVLELDVSTGDPVLDPCTNQPILVHEKAELIKKKNGTFMFFTKILPIFCEDEDIEIV